MAVGVEDGVDGAEVFAEGLRVEVGAGVDEDDAVCCIRGGRDGRVRRLCGSVEVQTAHWQPRVGTPMEVPLPRKVRVASMRVGGGRAG